MRAARGALVLALLGLTAGCGQLTSAASGPTSIAAVPVAAQAAVQPAEPAPTAEPETSAPTTPPASSAGPTTTRPATTRTTTRAAAAPSSSAPVSPACTAPAFGTTHVVALGGGATCPAAQQVLGDYLASAPSGETGNTDAREIQGWTCQSLTAGRIAETGAVISCTAGAESLRVLR